MADDETIAAAQGPLRDAFLDEEANWEAVVDEAIAESIPSRQEIAEPGESEPTLGELPLRAVDYVTSAAANVYDVMLRRHSGTPTPKSFSVILRNERLTVRRYSPHVPRPLGTIVLIPPLGAPVSCYDLRPGASLLDHLTWSGYTTYVADYGPITFADRGLGLEDWILEIIPSAIRSASADAGGPVHVAGWSLGGIMSLLTLAADPKLPAAGLAMIASPIDFERLTLLDPVRQIGKYTNRRVVTSLYRALGAAPAPLVSLVFRGTAIGRYLSRPAFVARNLANREALVHMRATDKYMANMHAYPGRTIGQLYHKFFWDQELANGKVTLADRTVDLGAVVAPVLVASSDTDVLAPTASAHAVGDLLTGSPDVRLVTVPGGHLGVLTGMAAPRHLWQHMRDLMADFPSAPRPTAAPAGGA